MTGSRPCSVTPATRCSTSRSRRRCSRRSSRTSELRVWSPTASGSRSRSRSVTISPPRASSPPSCTSTSQSPRSIGSITSWGRWAWRRSSTCASPTRSSSRSGTADSSTRSRSRWPNRSASRTGASFYDPVGALRDVVVNHLMQIVAAIAMEAPASAKPDTQKDAKQAVFESIPDVDPRFGACAASTRAISDGRRGQGPLRHRDVRGPEADHRQLALVGRADLHPHRQADADPPDRGAADVPPSRRGCRSSPAAGAHAGAQSTRRPGRPGHRGPRSRSTPSAPTSPGASEIDLDMRLCHGGRRGPDPV